jgi:tetratricopeptide (TPR) repeat protein
MEITNNNNLFENNARGYISMSGVICFIVLVVLGMEIPLHAETPHKNESANQQISQHNSSTVNRNLVKSGKTAPYLLAEKMPATEFTRKLWDSRISLVKESQVNPNRDQLKDLIRQIGFIEFKDNKHQPVITVEKIENDQAGNTSTDSKTTETDQQSSTPKLKHMDGNISEETLVILKKMAQKPEKLNNAFELAELLFSQGRLEEAAKCYIQALEDLMKKTNVNDSEKAWLLFQIGNCLHKTNPTEALKTYRQLIEEHPESQWNELAKIKSKVIDWYLQDKPHTLISKKDQGS